MEIPNKKNHSQILSKETWLFISLTLLCIFVLLTFVDLKPHIDSDTFFSSEDPSYKADIEISRLFPRNDTQIIISILGNIHSKEYQDNIRKFGDLLIKIPPIIDVKSIIHGPRNIQAAIEGPLFKRILISKDQLSSNILLIFDSKTPSDEIYKMIPKIEALKGIFDAPNFKIYISGFPYIVELIQRNLNSDLKVFSGLALLMFGLIIVLIFHSSKILIGMSISCFNAAALTLMITSISGIKIGILTANLTTIVFVLTLSHIVFLTFNWKHLHDIEDKNQATAEAIKMTWPASFWAMLTTLLGFLSLFYVQAQPIKELGAAGAIGTIVAFLIAYSIYPSFLRLITPTSEKADMKIQVFYKSSFNFFEKYKWLVLVCIFGIAILTAQNIKNIDTDPSLLSFFSPKSEITKGLIFIDKHGGSNPLISIIKSNDNKTIESKENLERLSQIQQNLEKHPDVGVVISLPILLEEARSSSFFSFLFSNKQLLKKLSSEKYNKIANQFITEDRQHTLIFARMKEEGRKFNRLKIVSELEEIIDENHMMPYLMGGVYPMQGHLSKHVSTSLIFGLTRLISIFIIIALITSYSFQTAFAMTFSICLIPLCILGVIGTFKIPLDMIAAPASNIAISMGIDAMIHMVHMYHRLKKQQCDLFGTWHVVREKLWEPILTSMLIVSAGFGIFFFSNFPPTQRFGGSIVLGTIIAGFSALFVFPLLSKYDKSEKPKSIQTPKDEANDKTKKPRFFIHQSNNN